MAMGPSRWGASLMVVNMAVGPSAPPMIPRAGGAAAPADDTQSGGFLRSEAHQHGAEQHRKDTQLGGRAEDGQAQVAEHGAEVGQRAHTHEDDGRQETGLDQHVVDEVHQSQLVGNLVERHLPDVLHHPVHHHHTVLVGLDDTHLAAGEVGDEHTEGDGHQQQRFVVLLDAQVEQDEGNGIHHEERRVGNDVAERRHVIEFSKYIFHYPIFINTSSSDTESPGFWQMAVTVPSTSLRMAL